MRNLKALSDRKQVCLVPNPTSQSTVILGRIFSVTPNGLCASVLLTHKAGSVRSASEPVLGMPTEKGMYVLDTDGSVENVIVAISGILHQEQEWNGEQFSVQVHMDLKC